MSIVLGKLRVIFVAILMVGMLMVGFVPSAYAGVRARGGNGGNGGIAVGVGVCAVNISLLGSAGCRNNGTANASGGNGGNAIAIG